MSKVLALLFFDLNARRKRVIKATYLPNYPREIDPFSILQEIYVPNCWFGLVQKFSSQPVFDASTVQYICIQKYIVFKRCICTRIIKKLGWLRRSFANLAVEINNWVWIIWRHNNLFTIRSVWEIMAVLMLSIESQESRNFITFFVFWIQG